MFETLPERFREHGVDTDVRTLLLLNKAMHRGLVKTLGDMFNVLKGIVVKDPDTLGPFTKAYYDYFLNIEIESGERLDDAILRSETFKKWRDDKFEAIKDLDFDSERLVDEFLNDVHLTSYDIKEIINGKNLIDDDNEVKDSGDFSNELEQQRRLLEKMADYSGMSLEELLIRLEEIAKQQRGKHNGGSRWIGTGGISPFGHGGAAKEGLRIGGTGGGKMARKILNDRRFFPVDRDVIVNDNNVDAALASLKGIIEESAYEQLDIKKTIKNGLRRGGLFIPELVNEKNQKLQVMLLIDNGGYSMSPYVYTVQNLFKKMKTRFAHDLESYYFHNTIYDVVYSDSRRTKPVSIETILKKDPNYRIFIIGDAAMASYEINRTSVDAYKALTKKFKKIAWLNPEPKSHWYYTMTIGFLGELVPMFPLTPKGIEEAVQKMNKISNTKLD